MLATLNGQDIVSRWEPAPGVSCTRYSNGTEVTVNLSGHEFAGLAAGALRIATPAKVTAQ